MRVGRWFSVLPPGGGEKWGTRCLGRPAAGLTEHTVQLIEELQSSIYYLAPSTELRSSCVHGDLQCTAASQIQMYGDVFFTSNFGCTV